MSSFGADPRLLTSPQASNDPLPATTPTACGTRCNWLRVAIEVFADWIAVIAATSAVTLACRHLLRETESHYSSLTILQASLCIASLIVFLLANDGAYRSETGPLRIRLAERPIRIAIQAAVLIGLMTLTVNDALPPGAIAFSLLASTLLMIFEKQALFLFFLAFCARAREKPTALGSRLARRVLESSGSAQQNGLEVRTLPMPGIPKVPRAYDLQKRACDPVLALIGIVITSPVWLTAAILVRLDSAGPVLFRQERVGKDGRRFLIYKFRSMHSDAPMYEVSPDNPGDKRITRIGRFLRMCSLDELPQLLNVLKGEMSLVGPRPEMPFLVQQHRALHRERLQVIPGITGLWQLSPARAARIHENVQYDSYYVRNRNLSMDLAILLYTPLRLLRGI